MLVNACFMETITNMETCAPATVKAKCSAVEDMGMMDTMFGKKRLLKFTFETDQVNEYGYKRRLTRLFNRHTHPKSSISIAAKAWCGRDLAAEEADDGRVNWQSFVGLAARLKLEPGAVKDGKCYEKIVEILP